MMRSSRRSETKRRLMAFYCRFPWALPFVQLAYNALRLAND